MIQHSTILAVAAIASASLLPAQWTETSPATSPAPRAGHGMAYDLSTNATLLFGGDTFAGLNGMTNETWRYDGSTWTQLATTTSPHATQGIELVYDASRSVFVFYGGSPGGFIGGAAVDRTWEFDGVDWTERFPATTPGGLTHYAMSYDLVRGVSVLYGGQPSTLLVGNTDDTWEWDGTDWTLADASSAPGPLERASMCFHVAGNVTILFGGINVVSGGVDTTWIYDGSTWTAANVTGPRPSVRTGAQMVYDTERQVCVLTGGQNPTNGTPFDDTWEYDLLANTWTPTGPAYTGGRLDMGMVYDVTRAQTVMFGGIDFQSFTAYGDTWEYGPRFTAFGTGCPGSNGTPAHGVAGPPRTGNSYTLEVDNLNTSTNIGVFALSLSAISPTPLDAIGMTGCTGYVAPDVLLTANGASGAASVSLTLPTNLALMGVDVFSQALSLDPGINALWLAASNGGQGTIGR